MGGTVSRESWRRARTQIRTENGQNRPPGLLTHQSHSLDTASVTVSFQSEAAWDTHHAFPEGRFRQELRFAGVTKVV